MSTSQDGITTLSGILHSICNIAKANYHHSVSTTVYELFKSVLNSAIVHSNVKQTVICASMFVVQSAAVWPKTTKPKHKFSALVLTSFFFFAAINVEKHYSRHTLPIKLV